MHLTGAAPEPKSSPRRGDTLDDFERALAAVPSSIADMQRLQQRVDVKRGRIELTAAELDSEPSLLWNAFIATLGALPYERMTGIQRAAYLAYHYDGEVQDGGHLQFFVNDAEQPPREVAAALDELSLPAHAELVRKACARWQEKPRRTPASAEEFSKLARAGEFDDIDAAYHDLSPTISDALQSLVDERHAELGVIKL